MVPPPLGCERDAGPAPPLPWRGGAEPEFPGVLPQRLSEVSTFLAYLWNSLEGCAFTSAQESGGKTGPSFTYPLSGALVRFPQH